MTLRELLKEHNISVSQLPKINRVTLWRHLKSQRRPDVRHARIYAPLMGMSIEEFYDALDGNHQPST